MLDNKYNKGHHVEEIDYYYSPEQALIGNECESGISIGNIGKEGENLTIAVLSMNRASLTIRLMNSIKKYIPYFAGEFLIGDNGSEENEKKKLYDVMNQMPFRCRMVEFGKNFGVSGGRNRLYKEVQTDWIMSLDNDLYLIGNPLAKIQKDLAILGCHFMAIPIIDKGNNEVRLYGGHLYVENLLDRVGIGGSFSYFGDSTCPVNIEYPPFLCSFLPGYAAIINKASFFAAGAFEEQMFVGFEDTEFSVRLFQKGMKVGGCGMVSFVHDHPKPQINADVTYEKKRFATDLLKESGQFFERKHGFSVWNLSSEEWVNKRLQELVLETTEQEKKNQFKKKVKNKKPKIALIIDKPEWALDNIASQIIKNLSDQFEFKKIYLETVDCLAGILLVADDCDLIHFLWRPLATAINDDYTKQFIHNIRMPEEKFYDKYVASKVISVAVYDHFFLDKSNKEITLKLFSDPDSIVSCYTVSSRLLDKIYRADPEIVMKPSEIIQDGVDCGLFIPQNLERFDNTKNRPIRIGWVGNSKLQVGDTEILDLKGIHTIIRPAVEKLKSEGYNIELYTSDRNHKMIPHNEMPGFYAGVDIYVCASLCEGTPNPVLEAMASGIPVISTDVGIVKEAFGPLQKEYILKERSSECLEDALKKLLDNPERMKKLSEENLKYIKSWDWTIICEKFRKYFSEELEKKGRNGKKI